MKKTRLLIVFSLIFCCLLAVCSCEKLPALEKPDGLEIEQATLVLTWDEVEDARLYTISIQKTEQDAKEFIASKPSYSLASLEAGEYTIRIMARGKEGENLDSAWSEKIEFTREQENGLVFALTSDKTAYTVTGKGNATGNIIIPDTYRGLPVVGIGDMAFFNKSDVTGISFGENSNVKSIGAYAFGNCSYLTSLALPKGLETIGNNAFASCRMLAVDMVIPSGVKTISPSAFSYSAITGITIPESVTLIDKYAFTDCKGLTEIVIPKGVKKIGDYAFAACENVEEITIGEDVEEISAYAFSRCTKITSVLIPESVTKLGEGAFYQCSELASATIGERITEIAAGVFNETKLWDNSPTNEVYVGKWFLGIKDTSVESADIVHGTVGIGGFALANNKKILEIRLPDSVKIICEGAFAGSKLNAFVLGSGVEIIGEQAFIACKDLTTVYLGSFDSTLTKIEFSSLKEIGSYAFQECETLSYIEIPASVKVIGSYAFKDSGLGGENGVIYAGLEHGILWAVGYADDILGEIEIASGTVGIANYAFYKCQNLTDVIIPSSVKTIGRAAFYDCTSLRTISLPDTLEVIEDYTFYRCRNLKLFTLPPVLKSIGRSAFYKCGSSELANDSDTENDTLYIPASVESIGDFAFYGCVYENSELGNTERYGVDVLIIGNGVSSIGANAFYGITSLKKVQMTNVKTIGEKAFYKCTLLAEVDFGTSLEVIGEKAFYKCEALTAVQLPNSLETVSDYAFYKCTSIASVDLGSGVTSIGEFAFYGDWAISYLYLPTSLTSIGKQAFRNCDKLTSVILSSNIQSIDKHAFYGCDNMTVFTELSAAPEGWAKHWNSSYRPVVWNCNLSEDKDYVISVEIKEKGVTNKNNTNKLSAPVRVGYVFVGWGSNSSATTSEISMEQLPDAETGRKLFAIWQEESAE